MKIDRTKTAEALKAVFLLNGDTSWGCPDCFECVFTDDEFGCDTCYPIKVILHKGY